MAAIHYRVVGVLRPACRLPQSNTWTSLVIQSRRFGWAESRMHQDVDLDRCAARLEILAEEHIDPEKLKWRRAMSEINKYKDGLSPSQFCRIFNACARHPISLFSSSVQPFLAEASQHTSPSAIAELTSEDLVALTWALAHAGNDYKRATPRRHDGLVDMNGKPYSGPGSHVLNRLEQDHLKNSCTNEGEASSYFLWSSLLPQALSATMALSADASRLRGRALLAAAIAWRRIPSLEAQREALPKLAAAIEVGLESIKSPALRGGPDALSEFVGALGILSAHSALEPILALPLDGIERRRVPNEVLVRSLLPTYCEGAGLPSLLLLDVGLRGLGLGDSRLGAESHEKFTELLEAAPGMREVVASLLTLRAIGHLGPSEPWVLDLVRLATNAIDALQEGERAALRGILESLAQVTDCSRPHPAGSAEAMICGLARHQWFSRKSRSQISWYKQRSLR